MTGFLSDLFNTPLHYIFSIILFCASSGCLCYVTIYRRSTLARYQFIFEHQRELTCQCKFLHPLPQYSQLSDSLLPTYQEALLLA